MRRVLHAVPHAIRNEQGTGYWNAGSAGGLWRCNTRNDRSRGCDEQRERSRTHNMFVVGEEGWLCVELERIRMMVGVDRPCQRGYVTSLCRPWLGPLRIHLA